MAGLMNGLENHILDFIKHFLGTVGYPGVFLLMAIEGFGVPIPSELTMPFSGFLTTHAGGSKFVLPAAVAAGLENEREHDDEHRDDGERNEVFLREGNRGVHNPLARNAESIIS